MVAINSHEDARMNTYRVKPEGFNSIQKRIWIGGILAVIFALTGVAAIISLEDRKSLLAFGLTVATVFIVAGFVFYRSTKRLRESWQTYTLMIGDDLILRQQSHYPDITIRREEITKIQRVFTGDIVVKTKEWMKFISIPRSLNGIEEVEQILNQWKSVKQAPNQKLFLALTILVSVASFFGILFALRPFLSDHRPGFLTSQIFPFIIAVVALIALSWLRRFPHIDDRSKPKRWQFILVVAYLMLTVISIVIFAFCKSH
jgi:hypothetical protein